MTFIDFLTEADNVDPVFAALFPRTGVRFDAKEDLFAFAQVHPELFRQAWFERTKDDRRWLSPTFVAKTTETSENLWWKYRGWVCRKRGPDPTLCQLDRRFFRH